jgi:hypothetical protein
MEVGQGRNWGCSAKGKKIIYLLLHYRACIKGEQNEMKNSYSSPKNRRVIKTMKPERDEICNIHWED